MIKLNLRTARTGEIARCSVEESAVKTDRHGNVIGFTVNYKDGTSESFVLHERSKGHVVKNHFSNGAKTVISTLGGTAAATGGNAYGRRLGTLGAAGGVAAGTLIGWVVKVVLDEIAPDKNEKPDDEVYGYFDEQGTLIFDGPVKVS